MKSRKITLPDLNLHGTERLLVTAALARTRDARRGGKASRAPPLDRQARDPLVAIRSTTSKPTAPIFIRSRARPRRANRRAGDATSRWVCSGLTSWLTSSRAAARLRWRQREVNLRRVGHVARNWRVARSLKTSAIKTRAMQAVANR